MTNQSFAHKLVYDFGYSAGTHMDIWLGLAWHKKPIGYVFIQSISLDFGI
ncbi:MAG: hypothetical protein WCC17_21040 [Candidatus Nitrosopolaris sp.]